MRVRVNFDIGPTSSSGVLHTLPHIKSKHFVVTAAAAALVLGDVSRMTRRKPTSMPATAVAGVTATDGRANKNSTRFSKTNDAPENVTSRAVIQINYW